MAITVATAMIIINKIIKSEKSNWEGWVAICVVVGEVSIGDVVMVIVGIVILGIGGVVINH
jgi:hypothetical protein